MNEIVEILISLGDELLKSDRKAIRFSGDQEADSYLNDIKNYPHAFVLACVMDRQIKAERAWIIPYKISVHLKDKSFRQLLNLSVGDLSSVFKKLSLHRFNDMMAENYFHAINRIHDHYHDDASNIWQNKPSSARVVRRFLQFKGVGIKIATMAANILVRDFKVPMKDYTCIDISPDVQVKRVFKRLGLTPSSTSNDELIYAARELYPSYPGIFDLSCWEIGRKWCTPSNPSCEKCFLNDRCPKLIQ